MKLSKIVMLGILFGFSQCKVSGQTQPRIFDANKNKEYLIEQSVYENVYGAAYDFNKNGVGDVMAFYEIVHKDSLKIRINDKAFMVGIDLNEDGIIDEIYLDKDFNGTLETKLEKKIKPKT